MSKSLLKNKRPIEVGLTGGIGAGKTLVARIFKVLGTPVFDADSAGHHVLEDDPEVQGAVIALLGDEAYHEGSANRAYIASQIFADDALRAALNAIVHPAVGRRYAAWKASHLSAPYLIRESALIFEVGLYENMDITIQVSAPESLRLARAMSRDKSDEAKIKSRMAAQWSDPRKERMAQYVIRNNEQEALIPQILQIHNQILADLKN